MTRAHIIAARRTAVAPRAGAFASCELHDLAAPVIAALLADAGIDRDHVGELIAANALGAGGNPARSIALAAGLPERVAGLTIDRQCCGGLDAVLLARALVENGQHDVVIAGGVESYSRRPLRSRTFADGRAPEPYDQAPFTPWPNRDPDMATAAATLAERLRITREEQDEWAISSHAKGLAADMRTEIVTVADLSLDAFTRALTPRIASRAQVVSGPVTAANMAVAADAAAFVLVVSEELARKAPGFALAITGGLTLGGDPEMPGLAPIEAGLQALESSRQDPRDLRVAEIMEAFAVQAIACQRGLRLDPDIVNPGGGGLARGHPIGASGAILAVRLCHELRHRGGSGLAAIAAAGGLGTALILQE